MNSLTHSDNKYINVDIKRPLYGNFCYIRDIYLNQARREHKNLRITTPNGTGIMTVEQWMTNCKEMKKVFKQPDNPMVLFGNTVVINSTNGATVRV